MIGYINRQIVKPGPETILLPPDSETPTIQPINTPIYSSKPTLDEWMFHDQLTRGHITLNCTDVAALGVTTTGTVLGRPQLRQSPIISITSDQPKSIFSEFNETSIIETSRKILS